MNVNTNIFSSDEIPKILAWLAEQSARDWFSKNQLDKSGALDKKTRLPA
jgi:hypothetical protein